MPLRPPKPCQHPGCGVLTKGTYCEPHSHRRATSTARGYGYAWQKQRERKPRTEPLCRICTAEGRATLAVEVDHIIRVADRPELRASWDNLQSLCQPCHAAKSAEERAATRG